MLIAIRSEQGKGVYTCTDAKDASKLVAQYPNCSNKRFKDNEKEQALKWAGVKEIANRPQQVVKTPVKSAPKTNANHPFVDMLEELRKRGNDCAKIEMSNGNTFYIWLGEIMRYVWRYEYRLDSRLYISRCYREIKSFAQNVNEFRVAYDEVAKQNRAEKDMTFDEVLRKLVRTIVEDRNSVYQKIKKTKIQMIGDFAMIDSAMLEAPCEKRFVNLCGVNQYIIKQDIENLIDVVVNVNEIVNIIPFTLDSTIRDKDMLKAIADVEKEMGKTLDVN